MASSLACFNPTLVRLRPAVRAEVQLGAIRFNPTLVRLRRTSGGSGGAPAPQFQSHAGSIEAFR